MSLTQEQIKHIARLAKLKLADGDIEGYQKDLNSIVDYIDILNSVPESELQNITVSSGMLRLREDEEIQTTSPDVLLSCSPKKVINHQIAIDNIMA